MAVGHIVVIQELIDAYFAFSGQCGHLITCLGEDPPFVIDLVKYGLVGRGHHQGLTFQLRVSYGNVVGGGQVFCFSGDLSCKGFVSLHQNNVVFISGNPHTF
ncbi:hypothetical protein FQZ97_767580 [compost metagenome]